ncbi:hypothetical protein PENTCL1PPCAC_18431, partial [Pristionchus entomophagus]
EGDCSMAEDHAISRTEAQAATAAISRICNAIVDSSTLGSSRLKDCVKLPRGEDRNEWLAANVTDLFKQARMIFGIVYDACTAESCHTMSAGARHEYFWTEEDGKGGQRIIEMPACDYIDYLLSAVGDQLDDETSFPSKLGEPFPPNFIEIVKSIVKRLFRIYAHVMTAHIEVVATLGAISHVNTSLKHFVLFIREFDLMKQEDLVPLASIIDRLLPRSMTAAEVTQAVNAVTSTPLSMRR